MSSLLTPNINPRKRTRTTKTIYDHGNKGYATSIAEVKRKYGSNAVQKAKAIVKEYATDDTKRLLLSDLGDDPALVHRVLEFGAQANEKMDTAIEELGGNNFYDNSPTMAKDRVKYINEESKTEFNTKVIPKGKQDYIDRNQKLEMI